MTGREKRIVSILLVLFLAVGIAALREGWLLFGNPARPNSPAAWFAAGSGKQPLIGDETGTPFAPVLDTPAALPLSLTETPAALESTPGSADLSLAAALQQSWTPVQQSWTTVTVFTPWGEPMVFSFLPVAVNFQEAGFDWVCPFYEQKVCISTQGDGVYALAHSEYPGAVGEQARSVVEGTLYPLETIRSNVASLPGAEARIELADGQVLTARVVAFDRVTGPENMYNLANQRQAAAGTLTIEFCGLPHLQDGTDPAGTTGSIYVLTLEKSD
jgi:hypothetical protein